MFEALDDPGGTPIDEGTKTRVAAIVRARAVRRRVVVAAFVLAAVAVPAGVVTARDGGGERTVRAADDVGATVTAPSVPVPTTTMLAPGLDLEVEVPTTLPATTTTTTRPRPTTTSSSTPPTTAPAGSPTLEGEWAKRAALQPDPNYGPTVQGEAGVRRVEGTQYRWTASFVATGLAPNSSGSLLISHETDNAGGGGAGPFASTACRYQADAEGRGTCTGEFDTYEYTNDPDRTIRWASVMGPSGNAVATARLG